MGENCSQLSFHSGQDWSSDSATGAPSPHPLVRRLNVRCLPRSTRDCPGAARHPPCRTTPQHRTHPRADTRTAARARAHEQTVRVPPRQVTRSSGGGSNDPPPPHPPNLFPACPECLGGVAERWRWPPPFGVGEGPRGALLGPSAAPPQRSALGAHRGGPRARGPGPESCSASVEPPAGPSPALCPFPPRTTRLQQHHTCDNFHVTIRGLD